MATGDTERWSETPSERPERLRDVLQGLVEPTDLYGLAKFLEPFVEGDVKPGAQSFYYGTQLRVKPHQIKSDPRLIAEFEGVLAFRRTRPTARTLVMIRPGAPRLLPDDLRAAFRDRANLAWLAFGEVALSPRTEKPALRSLTLAPLPGAETGLSGQVRPFGGLGPDVLRAVPTGELVDLVVQDVVGQEQWARLLEARGQELPARLRGAIKRAHAAGSSAKRGRPTNFERYAEVAARVTELERNGHFRGAAKTIAAEKRVPESTAYRWIKKSRELGLLPSLEPKGDHHGE